MGGRLNRSLATVWQGIAVVSVLVWFWKMFPMLGPLMMHPDYTLRPGWVWWTLLLAVPPSAVLVWMDRASALLLGRPGFWTRHRQG
jgi:hypothetical protein